MQKISLLLLTGAVLLISVIRPTEADKAADKGQDRPKPLFNYDFENLKIGDIVSQDGWQVFPGWASPQLASGSGSNASKVAGASEAPLPGLTGMSKPIDFHLKGNETLLLECDVYTGRFGAGWALMGLGTGKVMGAHFGLFDAQQAMVRGEAFGTLSTAKTPKGGALRLERRSWYRLRSTWRLDGAGQGTASLEARNLTAGEETFTALVFDEAGTRHAVDLEIKNAPSTWDRVYIRTAGEDSDLQLDNVRVSQILAN